MCGCFAPGRGGTGGVGGDGGSGGEGGPGGGEGPGPGPGDGDGDGPGDELHFLCRTFIVQLFLSLLKLAIPHFKQAAALSVFQPGHTMLSSFWHPVPLPASCTPAATATIATKASSIALDF